MLQKNHKQSLAHKGERETYTLRSIKIDGLPNTKRQLCVKGTKVNQYVGIDCAIYFSKLAVLKRSKDSGHQRQTSKANVHPATFSMRTQLREYTLRFLTYPNHEWHGIYQPTVNLGFSSKVLICFHDFYPRPPIYLQERNKNNISWFLVEGLAVCRNPVAKKKKTF